MQTYTLHRKQFIAAPIKDIWDFFSDARNLATITPTYMNFRITSGLPDTIHTGQTISYKVSPIAGIPLSWTTEIRDVEPCKRFVDIQLKGPYKLWQHEHRFDETDGGVWMSDTVTYILPYSFLGILAHGLFIKRQLDNIFDYRYQKIETMFNKV